jgi:hypothetical protein
MLELDDIADVVATAVREANAPLLSRIVELEQRALAVPVKGEPGKDGAPGQDGAPGEVDMDQVKALIADAVAALPVAEKGEPGKDGQPGASVDMAEVEALIGDAVAKASSAIPVPKDGEPGRDGAGLADVLRDADGNLVVVLSDGRTKSLGKIDGEDGQPGRDGLGFDDLEVEQINQRTVRMALRKDGHEAVFDLSFPVPIYRGVFDHDAGYESGDLVTWGGSLWHCNEAKGLKPGAPDSGWQLAAKAGRPGKDAK